MLIETTGGALLSGMLLLRVALANHKLHFLRAIEGSAKITKLLLCQLNYGGAARAN